MSLTGPELTILGSAMVLGLRHGVDYDHVAAISDITWIEKSFWKGTATSLLYALGHGTVVMILIGLAFTVGSRVPGHMDEIAVRLVGLTLLALGVLVLRSLLLTPAGERPLSRGMLLVQMFQSLRRSKPHSHSHPTPQAGFAPLSVFGIGVIHGIGAETPTQVLLIVLAAGFSAPEFGLLVGALFVAGILITNIVMSLIFAMCPNLILKRPRLYRSLMAVSALYSLTIGVVFAAGLEAHLPHLL